jgi:ferredoxin/flavodoxin
MDIKIFIMFSSPAGSTRKVALFIKEEFQRQNMDVQCLDISQGRQIPGFLKSLKTAGRHVCLFLGSPVYRDVAVPPIIDAIEKLPQMGGAFAVPFVTWGQACSGVALWQMGKALRNKGFKIAGAAKVLAVHSLMWQTKKPAGEGHPDQSDQDAIKKLVGTLKRRFESENIPVLSLDTLDYQDRVRADQMKNKIDAPWMNVPKDVDSDSCTQCGICRDECPVEAVVLDPWPRFEKNCFDCFNCVRLCPEGAVRSALSMREIEEHIRTRVRTIAEQPYTQIFL